MIRAFAFAPCRDRKAATEGSSKPILSENNTRAVQGQWEGVQHDPPEHLKGGGVGGAVPPPTLSINHNQVIAGLKHSNHGTAGG